TISPKQSATAPRLSGRCLVTSKFASHEHSRVIHAKADHEALCASGSKTKLWRGRQPRRRLSRSVDCVFRIGGSGGGLKAISWFQSLRVSNFPSASRFASLEPR